LVACGSSGGHIFPALGFLDILKDKFRSLSVGRDKHRDIDILLILPKRSIINQIETLGYKVKYISISPIKLNIDFKNIVAISRFFKGIFESIFILLSFKPDVVIGFGSLVCIPIVILAWAFRIKTLIHEQNVIPGRANRFLAKFTDKIAISFEETKNYLKSYKRKIIFTGNPLRKGLVKIEKNRALDFFGLGYNKFTILVMGGSIGSHSINLGFLNAISMMSDRFKLQIIHLTGLGDCDLLKDRYKDLNINIKLFSFLKAMQYAYSASDLVICRAGATTIAEIISFGLPAIIVPYPFAYEHQLNNAKVLENNGCAIIIKDNELDTDILRQTIEDLTNNFGKIQKMRSRYGNIPRPATNDLLVDEVFK